MDFFSKIFKHKKIFAFLILFFILSGIILPKIATAATPPTYNPGPARTWTNFLTFGYFDNPTAAEYQSALNDELSFLTEAATPFFNAIIVGITDLLTWATWSLANIASNWFSDAIIGIGGPGVGDGILNWNITTFEPFLIGWTEARDLSNMLIVLGFIVVAISFALRLGEYGSKKVLVNLVIVALLINFSGLFCGLIIDASNIATQNFLSTDNYTGSGGRFGNECDNTTTTTTTAGNADLAVTTIMPAINQAATSQLTENLLKTNTSKYVAESFMFIAMYIIVTLVFGYMLIVMLERYIMLGILFVLSPLAFFAWVFPATKTYFGKWWQEFLKYAFIGVGAGFFLWIAEKIISSPAATDPNTKVVNLFYLFIVLVFLFISYKLLKKSSVIANSVVGLAKQAAGMAIGATIAVATGGTSLAGKGVMKGLDAATGGKASAAKQAITGTTGRIMESMGIRKVGTTATNEASRVSEVQKGYEAALSSGNAADKATVQKLAKTGTGAKKPLPSMP